MVRRLLAPGDEEQVMAKQPSVVPAGEVYDWYRRGMSLLEGGNPAAAAALLEHAVRVEPESRSLREGLARAQYASRDFESARDNFAVIVEVAPSDDYAQFGLGLAQLRTGALDDAAEHLALAVAMRPENKHYGTALNTVRVARQRATSG
jgi:Flp pilus assembly protein TadD